MAQITGLFIEEHGQLPIWDMESPDLLPMLTAPPARRQSDDDFGVSHHRAVCLDIRSIAVQLPVRVGAEQQTVRHIFNADKSNKEA